MEKTYSILLVDDDPFILDSVNYKLCRRGYSVRNAESGEKALEFLESERFDIVITDLVMYEVTGIDVLKIAKQKHPQTIVIILTGNQDTSSTIDALRHHADDFILKSSSIKEICFRLEKCIERLELTDSYHHIEKIVQERTRELKRTNMELKKQIEEREAIEKKLRCIQFTQENLIEERTQSLQETNTALHVLVNKREKDIREIEERISINISRQISPLLERMKNTIRSSEVLKYIAMLENSLEEIKSHFTQKISLQSINLTPTEIQVASFIRSGKTTKDISELMGCSYRTVETHRAHIRKKVGLLDRKGNLETYLLNMTR